VPSIVRATHSCFVDNDQRCVKGTAADAAASPAGRVRADRRWPARAADQAFGFAAVDFTALPAAGAAAPASLGLRGRALGLTAADASGVDTGCASAATGAAFFAAALLGGRAAGFSAAVAAGTGAGAGGATAGAGGRPAGAAGVGMGAGTGADAVCAGAAAAGDGADAAGSLGSAQAGRRTSRRGAQSGACCWAAVGAARGICGGRGS